MGRININFHMSYALSLTSPVKIDAIPARDLAMVLLTLPGTTYVTGCVTNIQNPTKLYIENTVEAENDQLPDGTNITVRYKREVTMIGGLLKTFTVYDGIDIEQPKSPAAYQAPPAYGSNMLPTGKPVSGSGSLGPCTNGHNWKTYTGLHSTEEYCTACGAVK